MKEWYIEKCHEAHKAKRWIDRRNYANAAAVDFVRVFYLLE